MLYAGHQLFTSTWWPPFNNLIRCCDFFFLRLFTATLWLALTKIAILILLRARQSIHIDWKCDLVCHSFQRIFTVQWFPSCHLNECIPDVIDTKSLNILECPRTFTASVQLDTHTQSNRTRSNAYRRAIKCPLCENEERKRNVYWTLWCICSVANSKIIPNHAHNYWASKHQASRTILTKRSICTFQLIVSNGFQ